MRAGAHVLTAALLALTLASPAAAKQTVATASNVDAIVADIRQSMDEQRLLDAEFSINRAIVAGVKDPRLVLLDAEVAAAREKYADALATFREAEKFPSVEAQALQGEGISLSLLGRSEQAIATLKLAVSKDPTLWRAWNALGSEYDNHLQWTDAEQAYNTALATSGGAAIVLNNRGYSRLLQRRRTEAVDDLVAALRKKPDLSQARTNLRMAMAMGGEYDRAVAGGSPGDEARMLNNAGFVAAMQGDYAMAETLLNRALKSKGEFYDRASENLKIVHALAAQNSKVANASQ